MSNKTYKRKLSNYLLDKSLQLRYILFVTAVSAIICGALGYLIYQQSVDASETIRNMTNSYDPDLQAAVSAHLQSDDSSLVLIMVSIGIGLVVVLSMYLLVMTHKVAGPLYKVTLYLDKMRDGRLDQVWPLRKGDQLQSFYEKFQRMHTTVRARHVECNDKLSELVDKIESMSGHPFRDDAKLRHQLEDLKVHCEQRKKALA